MQFGAHPSQAPIAQSALALIRPIASGENNIEYVFSRFGTIGAATIFAAHNLGAPRAGGGGSSTGASGNPSRQAADNSIVYGQWQHVAMSWNGGLIASTAIKIYVGQKGAPLAETAYSTAEANGLTAASSSPAEPLNIGNRGTFDRTFNGDIAYVAQWNRVLSLQELRTAQAFGPLAVRCGLIFFWDGERDWGPFHLQPTSKIALVLGVKPPYKFLPKIPSMTQFAMDVISRVRALFQYKLRRS